MAGNSGLLASIAAIIRIPWILDVKRTVNNPRATALIGIFSLTEPMLGIMAASAVALRPLVRVLFGTQSKAHKYSQENAQRWNGATQIKRRGFFGGAAAGRKGSRLRLREDVEEGTVTQITARSDANVKPPLAQRPLALTRVSSVRTVWDAEDTRETGTWLRETWSSMGGITVESEVRVEQSWAGELSEMGDRTRGVKEEESEPGMEERKGDDDVRSTKSGIRIRKDEDFEGW